MPYFKDLRDYLSFLETKEKLFRITETVNKDTELHPLARWQFRGLDEPSRRGFVFENVTDIHGKKYDGQVATAVISPSREVYSLALQCDLEAVHDRWAQALSQPIAPKVVAEGPVHEEVHIGENLLAHGGFGEFPIPMATNGWESLPRVTAACWHTKDPETGSINVGTYNATILSPTECSCRAGVDSDIEKHWDKYRRLGKPMPAAMVIGPVPALAMCSVANVPFGTSELDVAGGLVGEPLEVVRCKTVDLVVPATAEIVFEGYIATTHMEADAASGEHGGYMMVGRHVYAFEVTCITHRGRPIWHDFISQMPPSESSTIRSIATEGRMRNFLVNNCGIPNVGRVAFLHSGGGWRICVVQMQDAGGRRTHNSTVWQALLATQSMDPTWPKLVFAVDDDIDPWDVEALLWAFTYRCQPHRDIKIIQGRHGFLDQSSGPLSVEVEEREYPMLTAMSAPMGTSSMLVDATRKWPYSPISLPKKEYMERGKELWDRLIGEPKLTPRMPWYGVSFGGWPEKYVRHAQAAERGDYESVIRELRADRIVPEGAEPDDAERE